MQSNEIKGPIPSELVASQSIQDLEKEIKKLSPLLGCLENFNELEQMPIEDDWKFSSSV